MKNKMQLFLTATLLFTVLTGCSSDHTDPVQTAAAGEEDSLDNSTSEESGADLKVLIDYFDRVTGTPMELPYDRIILYESENEDVLCIFRDIATESETVSRYSVSKDGYLQVLKVIYDKEMDRWNLRDDTYPIDGGYYYLNYWNGEKYVQVTSDAMPDSGFGDFAAVEKSMYGLLEDASLLETIDLGLLESQKKNQDGIVTKRQMAEWLEAADISEYPDIISVRQEIMEKNEKEYTHINVYLEEGFFPGEDLHIAINEVIEWGSFPFGETHESVNEVGFGYRWPLNEGKRYCTAMYTSDTITLKEWSLNECSGTVMRCNVPARFLHEDEKGQYVLLEDANDKCYMDGTEEIIRPDGTSYISDSLWTDNPYF